MDDDSDFDTEKRDGNTSMTISEIDAVISQIMAGRVGGEEAWVPTESRWVG